MKIDDFTEFDNKYENIRFNVTSKHESLNGMSVVFLKIDDDIEMTQNFETLAGLLTQYISKHQNDQKIPHIRFEESNVLYLDWEDKSNPYTRIKFADELEYQIKKDLSAIVFEEYKDTAIKKHKMMNFIRDLKMYFN